MKLEPQDSLSIEPVIYKSISRYFEKKEREDFEKKIFDIQQTANIMGKSYNWVDSRMKDCTLSASEDGEHVSGKVINKYLRDYQGE